MSPTLGGIALTSWTRWSPEVHSNPNSSNILWFCSYLNFPNQLNYFQWPSFLLFSWQKKTGHLKQHHKVSMDFVWCLYRWRKHRGLEAKHLQFRQFLCLRHACSLKSISGANIQQLHQKQLKDIFLPKLHSPFTFCLSFLKQFITSQEHMLFSLIN